MAVSDILARSVDFKDIRGIPVSYPDMAAIEGLERAVIMSEGPVLDAADFLMESNAVSATKVLPATGVLKLDTLERQTISAALDQHKGNISHAAKALGITRTALYRRMEKHGL